MPSEVMRDITLRRVTPASGEEALGKWGAPYRNHGLDSEPGSSGNLNGCRARGLTMPPRGARRRVLKPRAVWEGPLGIRRCCQPDSGKPTVRDERGAHGDVDYGGIRNPLLGSKERRSETLHLQLHAPCFYPTPWARGRDSLVPSSRACAAGPRYPDRMISFNYFSTTTGTSSFIGQPTLLANT